jgi:glycyl-tRNA synthetase beta chain
MAAGWLPSLRDLLARARAHHTIRSQPLFLSILDSARRIANITAGQAASPVRTEKLVLPEEKRLAELSAVAGDQIEELVRERRYETALDSFAGLAPELEDFFNAVLVMADDEELRTNRMALLQRVGRLVSSIGDVTRIVVARRELSGR